MSSATNASSGWRHGIDGRTRAGWRVRGTVTAPGRLEAERAGRFTSEIVTPAPRCADRPSATRSPGWVPSCTATTCQPASSSRCVSTTRGSITNATAICPTRRRFSSQVIVASSGSPRRANTGPSGSATTDVPTVSCGRSMSFTAARLVRNASERCPPSHRSPSCSTCGTAVSSLSTRKPDASRCEPREAVMRTTHSKASLCAVGDQRSPGSGTASGYPPWRVSTTMRASG